MDKRLKRPFNFDDAQKGIKGTPYTPTAKEIKETAALFGWKVKSLTSSPA